MIEPLRFHRETAPSFVISRPAFCGLCLSQKKYRDDPNVALKYCSECPRLFLCQRCDDEAHVDALTRLHVRRLLVIGPGVRKKVLRRGDARNFPKPLDWVHVKVKSRIYLQGDMIGKEEPMPLYFQTGLSGESVHVQVLGARGIPAADAGGTSDPVIVALFQGRNLGETRVRQRTLSPDWDNETFIVPVNSNLPPSRELVPAQKGLFKLELYDYDFNGNDFLGHVEIHTEELVHLAKESREQPIRLPFTSREFHGNCFISFGVKPRLKEKHWMDLVKEEETEDEPTEFDFVIRIDGAESLDKLNAVGYSDPLCKVYFGDKFIGETPHKEETLNPSWDRFNEFRVPVEEFIEREDELIRQARLSDLEGSNVECNIFTIELEDYNYWLPNRSMGTVRVPVRAIRKKAPIEGLPYGDETEPPPPPKRRKRRRLKTWHDEQEQIRKEKERQKRRNKGNDDISRSSKSKETNSDSESNNEDDDDEDLGWESFTEDGSEDFHDSDYEYEDDLIAAAKAESEMLKVQNFEEGEGNTDDEKSGDGDGDESGSQPLKDKDTNTNQMKNKEKYNEKENDDSDTDSDASFFSHDGHNFIYKYLCCCCAPELIGDKKKKDPTVWSPQYKFAVEKENKSAVEVENDDRGVVIVRLISSNRGNVVMGLDEGVRCMSLGETATIKVRFDHAYNSYLMGSNLPPRSNIVFTVELQRINGKGFWTIPWRQSLRFFRMSKRISKRLMLTTTFFCRQLYYMIGCGDVPDDESSEYGYDDEEEEEALLENYEDVDENSEDGSSSGSSSGDDNEDENEGEGEGPHYHGYEDKNPHEAELDELIGRVPEFFVPKGFKAAKAAHLGMHHLFSFRPMPKPVKKKKRHHRSESEKARAKAAKEEKRKIREQMALGDDKSIDAGSQSSIPQEENIIDVTQKGANDIDNKAPGLKKRKSVKASNDHGSSSSSGGSEKDDKGSSKKGGVIPPSDPP
jgi:hypothetical protein